MVPPVSLCKCWLQTCTCSALLWNSLPLSLCLAVKIKMKQIVETPVKVQVYLPQLLPDEQCWVNHLIFLHLNFPSYRRWVRWAWEAEAGSSGVQGQPTQLSETFLKIKQRNKLTEMELVAISLSDWKPWLQCPASQYIRIKQSKCQAWWCTIITLVFVRWRQEDCYELRAA